MLVSARSGLLGVLFALLCASTSAQVLIQGPAGAVTGDDLRAAASRLPPASRQTMLSRPESVQRQANDLYVRRALAAEAERDGLDKDPVVAAQLRLARERVLSDARVDVLERAAAPSDPDLTRFARDLYRDNPERFKTPEQTRASHILVARAPDGSGREKAEALLAQLKAGASFAQLAREQSADTASAVKGGDLGWFATGAMVPEFEQAVAALKNPGEITGVVETRFGFHVARLDARRPAGVRTFDEVREDLERDVRAKVLRDARQQKANEITHAAQADAEAINTFSRHYQKP